ncbi:uncharacterized protein J3R85_006303 [Psidium guajava]|nr:uncharacterized protein J3R85_006303 [Psidium guajava]
MSCGGNCGCGAGCKCGDGCGGGCKMFPDMSYAENSSSEALVMGVAASEKTEKMEGGEMGVAGGENGCKCGSNCTCDPCTCNK